MITLVWWILSLFDVCAFTWLPVVIDCGLSALAILCTKNDSYWSNTLALLSAGGFFFAFCKHFCALSASGWWILLSPVWFGVATLLPGGYTLTNWFLSHFEIMVVPTWIFIVGIVADLLFLAVEIGLLISHRKS